MQTSAMLPEGSLKDQTAVITGGGSGIGLGIAEELGRLGAHLVLAGRNINRLDTAKAELLRQGFPTITVATDVRQPDQVQSLIEKATNQWGSLDILVNSAAGNFLVDTEKLSVNGWNAIVNTVLNGTFYCTRAAGLQMIRQGHGKILSIVASYAWTGGPRTVHSAAAKAGIVAMTRTLAVEWAHHGIRVNALCPGPTDTEGARPLWANPEDEIRLRSKIPVGRFGTVEEVARAASYLVSSYADYINGEVLVMDGGEWLGKGLDS